HHGGTPEHFGHVEYLEVERSPYGEVQVEILVRKRVIPVEVAVGQPIPQDLPVISLLFSNGLRIPVFPFDDPMAIVDDIDALEAVKVADGVARLLSVCCALNRLAGVAGIKVTTGQCVPVV